MSLYIKCPNNSEQQMLVEEVVKILLRDYRIPSPKIIIKDQTRYYFLPIPSNLSPHEKATLKVLMSEFAKYDSEIKTGIYDAATSALRKAIEEGKIKL